MNSVQKAHQVLEHLTDLEDEELREALPIPISPTVLRGLLPAVARHIPADPRELDAFLTGLGNFAHDLRSDHESAAA